MGAPVVVLAGGTGGAKLARGLLDVAGEDLVAVVNTGDDVEMYGAYVSPDPDLVTFWLADRIDERGWGLRDDTFHAMDQLRELGVDVWFNLGDRDLAIGLRRAERLREGATLTRALAELGEALGVGPRVLPMADAPVRTRVLARGRWVDFQAFMIRERGEGPVDGVEYVGVEAATPPREALEAIAAARARGRGCARARRPSAGPARGRRARCAARRSRGSASPPRAGARPAGARSPGRGRRG